MLVLASSRQRVRNNKNLSVQRGARSGFDRDRIWGGSTSRYSLRFVHVWIAFVKAAQVEVQGETRPRGRTGETAD